MQGSLIRIPEKTFFEYIFSVLDRVSNIVVRGACHRRRPCVAVGARKSCRLASVYLDIVTMESGDRLDGCRFRVPQDCLAVHQIVIVVYQSVVTFQTNSG